MPSSESQASIASHCEPVLTVLPVPPEVVAEFDPLSALTSKADPTDDGDSIFVEKSTSDNLAELDVICCLQEALMFNVVDTLDEGNQYSAADASYNGCSQALASSAESVNSASCDTSDCERMELNSKPHLESACSTPSASGDVKYCSSGSGKSYLQVWGCYSTHHTQNAVETGLSPEAAVSIPHQREIIKSDESCILPPPCSPASSSSSSNSDHMVFVQPPVAKKRSVTQSASDQSANVSDPVRSCVPTRVAPPPPVHNSELQMPTDSSERKTDASIVASKMAVSSVLPGFQAATDGLSVTPRMEVPLPLPAEEEQTITMSFPSPRPRVSPRPLPVDTAYSLSPLREQLSPSIMPTTNQQPPPFSPSTVPSPLAKVIAVGGVNILGMNNRSTAATRNNAKTSTSSDVSSPVTTELAGMVTSESMRTPPVPPPKQRKPSNVSANGLEISFDTADEYDGEDVKNSKCVCMG